VFACEFILAFHVALSIKTGTRLNHMCPPMPDWRVKFFECVGHSFANVAHFVFLRDVWIRPERIAVASRRATNLATHLPKEES
jgi:hypothetical protein